MSGLIGGFGTKSDIIAHDTGWVDLTSQLVNVWVANGTAYKPYYRKIGDMVYIRGSLKDGNAQAMIDLPSHIQPNSPVYFELPDGWSHTHHLYIDDNGGGVFRYLNTQNHTGVWVAITCNWMIQP